MPQADGELIAIFDADFCPQPDFLRQTVPHLVEDSSLGLVQTRWTHLNADYSTLTRVQALALDGHFVVEQTARSRSGLPMHFNGTAGIWRRTCIDDGGGWQPDTLCEDLDLSYRAQAKGWRFVYLPEIESPAELPPQILAFKRQQGRWAQGAVQCLRKLALPVLRSTFLSPIQKIMGLVHLSGYLAYPMMILMLLLSPFVTVRTSIGLDPLRFLTPLFSGPVLVYASSQRAIHPDWKRRLVYFPLLVLVGTGVAWNNTMGAWRGLWQWGGVMLRTPKFSIENQQGEWASSWYRMTSDRAVVGELALALYATVAAAAAWQAGNLGNLPFLILFALSFGLIAGLSLIEMRQGRRIALGEESSPGSQASRDRA
jgi:hypothetical protein